MPASLHKGRDSGAVMISAKGCSTLLNFRPYKTDKALGWLPAKSVLDRQHVVGIIGRQVPPALLKKRIVWSILFIRMEPAG